MILKKKIFNDPVYGFVHVPYGILMDLVDHPYFQRLRRIKQVGLTSLVYPGALHTRFHHALGALHLTQEAIETLRSKGTEITETEAEAVCIAILLHDIGHGPFSHALEHTIIDLHHEELSLMFMEELNEEFDGKLSLAIEIFSNKHSKKFLYQLVSGQLDMDRMDYLNRDSFFTGVSEGVIGYDRIIKMLAVHEGELVVEEKGIYSIEKFLIARRLMYWQVYLHKTGVAAEQMLINVLKRAKELVSKGESIECPRYLAWFLYRQTGDKSSNSTILKHFSKLDDNDLIMAIKYWSESTDPILSLLSKGLLERHIFRLEMHNTPIYKERVDQLKDEISKHFGIHYPLQYLIFEGIERNQAYNPNKDQIKILFKTGVVKPIEKCSDVPLYTKEVLKYYVCYPKIK
jgi:uncharacterized protein